jgi:ribonucleoside-diphosphate reductase alpha chain
MIRRRLSDRRHHELVDFQHDGHRFTGGIGRFPDGSIAELFINGNKVGAAAETSAQESALLASMALQHGCPLETIQHALTRKGVAFGPLGSLLLAVAKDGQ